MEKKKHVVAGLYMDDFFTYNNELYGVLKSEIGLDFRRFVLITKVTPNHPNWESLNPTLETSVQRFYDKDKKRN